MTLKTDEPKRIAAKISQNDNAHTPTKKAMKKL